MSKKIAVLLAGGVAVMLLPPVVVLFVLTPRLRGDLVTFLAAQTGYDVEIASLRMRVWPRVRIHGELLRVGGGAGEAALPPLVAVDAFEVESDLPSLVRRPRHLHLVRLDGLHVHVPPRAADVEDRRARDERRPGSSPLLVSRVEARRALIEIASTQPDKPPRLYRIDRLELGDVALDRPVSFAASLFNPAPPGQVDTSGRFGPWNREDVRQTPLSGTYVFTDADLGVFRGIGGRLTSKGVFGGTLDRMDVTGEADIADFSVDVSGRKVALATSFKAEVGGRTGDVQLQPVDVRFFDSRVRAVGAIVRAVEETGRVIALDLTARDSRVEDLVAFALKDETAPLTGNIDLEARLRIEPGVDRVLRRMRVEGEFRIARARFANLNVQRTLDVLGRRGRGETAGERGASVVSNLEGRFVLEEATLTFSRLTFSVPGMLVRLAGRYGLEDEALSFGGDVAFSQDVSRLAPEQARRWLNLAQPFVPGGTVRLVVPLQIGGTRVKPSFRADLKALGPDRPPPPDRPAPHDVPWLPNPLRRRP